MVLFLRRPMGDDLEMIRQDARVGAVFPQTEIGADPAAVREWAAKVESMGFDHVVVYDHVLGANAASRPGWEGPYTSDDVFHEVFVLYGYLAAITSRIELSIGVLVLPQRQTALAAKQAAAVDILSGGRLRLGVGVGWNDVEFEALGQAFPDRGERIEEQIDVMRMLWTSEFVTYRGRWHTISDAGLNPLPPNRPIPVWMGGGADRVMGRIGRLADGWFYPGDHPMPDDGALRRRTLMREAAVKAGRDPGEIGIEKIFRYGTTPSEGWAAAAAAWIEYGATHLSLNTMTSGLDSLSDHLAALEAFAEAVRA